MDLRRLRKGEWIAGLSGVALIVSLFLPWSEVDDGGVTRYSGWESLSVTDVFLLLLGISACLAWGVVAVAKTTAPGVAAEALVTPVALVMSIVMLTKIGDFDGVGWVIGLLATVGVLVGVLVGMRDERLSKPGRLTDQTGVPVSQGVEVETLPAPPPA